MLETYNELPPQFYHAITPTSSPFDDCAAPTPASQTPWSRPHVWWIGIACTAWLRTAKVSRYAFTLPPFVQQVFGFTTDGADDFAPKGFRAPLGGTNHAMRWFEALPDLGSAIPGLASCMNCCCVGWETGNTVEYQTIPINHVVGCARGRAS